MEIMQMIALAFDIGIVGTTAILALITWGGLVSGNALIYVPFAVLTMICFSLIGV